MRLQFADGIPAIESESVDSPRLKQLMQYKQEFTRFADSDPSWNLHFADSESASAFLIGQLTYLENEVYKVQIIPNQYKRLLDINTSAGGAATQYGYQIKDYAGVGRDIAPIGDDLPEVQVAYGYVTQEIASIGLQYSYTTQELRSSSWLRRPITGAKAEAVLDFEQQKINNVALVGSTEKGFTGLLDNVNVPTAAATASGTLIGSGTATQAIGDICIMIYKVNVNSAYNDYPNIIGLPPTIYNYLTQTFPGTTALQSILEWIRANNMAKSEENIDIAFAKIPQLETMGAGGSRRMIAYVKDPTRVEYIYPMPLRFLSPQFSGLKVKIPAESRYSGTAVRYPQSMYYVDNA